MSSCSPLAARLAQTFSPRSCIFFSSLLFSLGGLVTSQAPDLKGFLVGRAISGIGGAGIMSISFILVLELAPKKRRGLFIGLVNTGFTSGVSLGAVIAGALVTARGWVSVAKETYRNATDGTTEVSFLDSKPLGCFSWYWNIFQHTEDLHFRSQRSEGAIHCGKAGKD